MATSLFVAVGQSTATSTDGVTWTPRTMPAGTFHDVTYSVEAEKFVAVGDGVSATSPDGIVWSAGGNPGNARSVTWSASLGLFVAVGPGTIYSSADGSTWASRSTASYAWARVAWGGGRFVAIAPEGTVGAVNRSAAHATSTDGVTWSAGQVHALDMGAVAWSETLARFVEVAPDSFGSGTYYTSTDGLTWTLRVTTGGTMEDVVWDDGLGLFIAVGGDTPNDAGKRGATSPDGITWTLRTIPKSNTAHYQKVAVSDAGTLLALDRGELARSTDGGATWTNTNGVWSSGSLKYGLTWANPNRPPNAPILNFPAAVNANATTRLPWQFSDPDTGDTQSQAEVRYWTLDAVGARVGTATTVVVAAPTQHWDAPAGTFVADTDYEAQVRTWDSVGEVGPWSTSSFFTAGTPPTGLTIVTPTDGGTFNQQQTVEWSTPDQDAYQLQVLDELDAVVYDTGTVPEAGTRAVVVSFPDNGVVRTIQVRVQVDSLWGGWAEVTGTVSWLAPPTPTVTLYEDATRGRMLVEIVNPAPSGSEPAASYNDVYVTDPGEDEERKATLVTPNSTWTYHLPPSGFDGITVGSVRVVAVAENGVEASSEATNSGGEAVYYATY